MTYSPSIHPSICLVWLSVCLSLPNFQHQMIGLFSLDPFSSCLSETCPIFSQKQNTQMSAIAFLSTLISNASHFYQPSETGLESCHLELKINNNMLYNGPTLKQSLKICWLLRLKFNVISFWVFKSISKIILGCRVSFTLFRGNVKWLNIMQNCMKVMTTIFCLHAQ